MNEVLVKNLLNERKQPLLSLEFFPPKDRLGFGMLGSSIERMRPVRPDFVSVTYGAGGSTRDRTLDACDLLQKMGFGPVVVHLTCVGASRAELRDGIAELYGHGFRNIMCLRGDPPQGETRFVPVEDGLLYASELVALVKQGHPDICCGVAGYPEKHPEAASLDQDITNLRRKVDAGADFVTTQMFYENEYYFRFVEKCRLAGIEVPIIPGLMPVISQSQIERIIALSHAAFPGKLAADIEKAGGSGPQVEAIGMDWTTRQIAGLLEGGAPGIHLYILNRAKTATSPALIESMAHWRSFC
jgi:methylenetetrahydrofolate reductase (NADPH)